MVEHGGFYRTSDQTWVKLERIQFVGACNPPTDPGRKPLTHRYSSEISLLLRTIVCNYSQEKMIKSVLFVLIF